MSVVLSRWRVGCRRGSILRASVVHGIGLLALTGPVLSDAGVLPTGQAAAQVGTGPSASEVVEGQAKELLWQYYSYHPYHYNPEARPIPGDRGHPSTGWPESCVGVTLEDCFGGDPDCHAYGVGAGGASPTSATLIRDCTAPELPGIRAEVLSRLDSLGRLAPGSDWIVGQRVNFAVKNGDGARALEIARSCEAAQWWCQALRGYALHHLVPGSGGAAFDSAYANAPPGTLAWAEPRLPESGDRGLHCEWADLRYLLEDARLLSEYERVPCGEHQTFADRFWSLADPLWSRPGNARRDEHVARNILMKLRDQVIRLGIWEYANPRHHAHVRTVPQPDRVSFRGWDGDVGHGIMIRLGVPNSWRGIPWSRATARGAVYHYGPTGLSMYYTPQNPTARPSGSRGQIREGFVNGGYSFAPDAGRYLDPVASLPDDWAVTWNEGHERMITGETWYNLQHHQTAVLRRGEALLAMAAARLPVLVSSFDGVQAVLAMRRPTDLRVDVAAGSVDPTGTARASVELEGGDWVASFETSGEGWTGRARHGAPAPVLDPLGFGLSSPVLLDERYDRGAVPLLSAMFPTTRLTAHDRVGVYFEVYGLEADETVRISLTSEPLRIERSLLGRIASALGVSSQPPPLRVEWSEAASGAAAGRTEHHLLVDLRGLADAGEYELSVQVERANGAVASASRRVSVTR